MIKQDGYTLPIFGNGGYCMLDFMHHWMMDAIHRQNSDDAYKYSRQLFHNIFMVDWHTMDMIGIGGHEQRSLFPLNGSGVV